MCVSWGSDFASVISFNGLVEVVDRVAGTRTLGSASFSELVSNKDNEHQYILRTFVLT